MFFYYLFDNLEAVSKLFLQEKYIPLLSKLSHTCWFISLCLTLFQIIAEYKDILVQEVEIWKIENF